MPPISDVSADDSVPAVSGTHSGSGVGVQGVCANGNGVEGISTDGAGVYGRGLNLGGVRGVSEAGIGVEGTSGSGSGVVGRSQDNYGVFGESNGSSFASAGVYGRSSRTGIFGSGDPGVRGESNSGYGVYGTSPQSTGVQGESGSGIGASGRSVTGYGVLGLAEQGTGVFGQSNAEWANGVSGWSPSGYGVFGRSDGRTGVQGECDAGIGVSGRSVTGFGAVVVCDSGIGTYSESTSSTGVVGYSRNRVGIHGINGERTASQSYFDAVGVRGESNSGCGVYGHGGSGIGVAGQGSIGVDGSGEIGVVGTGENRGVDGSSLNGVGVHGRNQSTTQPAVAGHCNAIGIGVRGFSQGVGVVGSTVGFAIINPELDTGVEGHGSYRGVAGFAVDANGIGVLGATNGRWAGYFNQDVNVVGTLYKGSSNFRIDHPLEPEDKYLSHCAVEAPEMKTVYDGVIVTDNDGFCEVEMPRYFSALNERPRYQLTVIGQFAQAVIERELDGNRFAIRTDRPRVRVSWQVTGVRRDAFARANPLHVEDAKPAEERGRYLHPRAYGKLDELSLAPKLAIASIPNAQAPDFEQIGALPVPSPTVFPLVQTQLNFSNPLFRKVVKD